MTAPEWAPGYRHRTHAIAPIPLEFKASPEDFVVEELPLAPPEGTGDVAWIWLEKRGLSTVEAVRRLAVALGVEPNQASFAGRKDVLAVTRQWVTVQGVDLDRAHGIEGRGWRVLAIERGEHALRMGRLAGNRFELVLHATREEDRGAVGEVLDALCSQGMPNYYGSQRFGRNGRGQDLARHLLAGDVDAYLEAYLGGEGEAAEELLRLIREGTWGERRKANELCGSLDASRAEVARQLARRPKDMDWLVRSIPLRDRRFQLSALQAVVFNRVVAERMAGGVLDVLWEGDVVRDPGGDWRTVEAELDPAPLPGGATGPLPGLRGPQPGARTAALELAALEAEGLTGDSFAALPKPLRPSGTRRELRVPVSELKWSWAQDRAQLTFVLPAGSYATTLLEELNKQYV